MNVAGFLQSAYSGLAASHLAPAYFAALTALAFAGFILSTNRHRRANQLWAAGMCGTAIWQAGIGLAQLYQQVWLLRAAVAMIFVVLWLGTVLGELIASPWMARGALARTLARRSWIVLIAVVPLTPYYVPWYTTDRHVQGPAFWWVEASGLVLQLWIFLQTARLFLRRNITAQMRSELAAVAVLFGPGSLVYTAAIVAGVLLQDRRLTWLAPSIILAELVCAWVLFARCHYLSRQQLVRAVVSAGVRGLLYAAVGAAVLIGAREALNDGMAAIIFLACLLGFGLRMQAVMERMIDGYLGRSLPSGRFAAAQLATNAATRAGCDVASLHASYRRALQEWSGGADRVFLSEGSFVAVWPPEPLPLRLVDAAQPCVVATPESVAASGPDWNEELHYFQRHRIGAVVCVSDSGGERLVTALSQRVHAEPYSAAELHEAGELLATMLSGSQLVRMRQQLRGSDRLNFYARYAPQFAHELRNGLYLQTALMRAIAAGRLAEVRPADAEAALERTEQIDRLCDHFFNVGTLFNRPIERIELRSVLERLVDKLGRQFDGGGHITLQTWLEPGSPGEVFANVELLNMAVVNLVKNAIEAAAPGTAIVEIAASRQLDKAHILVRDNGPGLPPDRCSDAFSPGKSHKRDGMGLGLSIVRDCMEAMGGTAGLRSTSASGCCFELTLGCAERVPAASAPCEYLVPLK